MLPDLHTRQEKPDWEYIAPDKRSPWQRLAAQTHGWVTPPNIITFTGLILVLCGLTLLVQGHLITGLVACAVGRFADILDGLVAARTHTKSAVGEQLDLIVDKLTVFVAVIVLLVWFEAPAIVVGLIVLINALNALATLLVRLGGSTKHPSRAGKYAMALCWLIILLLFIVGAHGTQAARGALYIVSILYALVGGWASYHYLLPFVRKK